MARKPAMTHRRTHRPHERRARLRCRSREARHAEEARAAGIAFHGHEPTLSPGILAAFASLWRSVRCGRERGGTGVGV